MIRIGINQDWLDYKLVHEFMCQGAPLKGWIREDNYFNVFLDSWDGLIPVVEKCFEQELPIDSNLYGELTHALIDLDKDEIWKACVNIIKFKNNEEIR